MYDRDNEIVLKMELPGMEQKDIHMAGTDDTLTIEGERRAEVEAGKIAATYCNGVLEVHLPKAKEPKTKKTEVQIQ
jgi:HSP20 family molecular chaperone IbpA